MNVESNSRMVRFTMITSGEEKDRIRMSLMQVLNTYFVQVSVVHAGVFIGVYWGTSVNLVLYFTGVAAIATVIGIFLTARSARTISVAFNKLSIETELLSNEVEELKKKVKELEAD